MSPSWLLQLFGVFALVQICRKLTRRVPLDPEEPPLLKSRVPLIGHILGFLWYRVDYFDVIRPKVTHAMATLPVLGTKMYVLWSPSLMQAAIRNKNLSFNEEILESSKKTFGLSEHGMSVMRARSPVDAQSGWFRTIELIPAALRGHSLFEMNVRALKSVGETLNGIDSQGMVVPNLYRWLQRLMTMATADGLYGRANPLRAKPCLINNLWNFDYNLQLVLPGLPIIGRTGRRNRDAVQAELLKFYAARADENEDVAEVIKLRSKAERKLGMTDEDIARYEISILFVSTTNTIPSLYWLFVHIWSRAQVIKEIREETLSVVRFRHMVYNKGHEAVGREAVVDITQLQDRCPLLLSCYRETIRLANQITGTRQVMRDTTLTDEIDGRSYLLKQGTYVTWSAKHMHRSQETWGDNADGFDPWRFVVKDDGEQNEVAKKRRQSYVPFGGGRHLCPGRNFALAENLGFMGALALGFDVLGVQMQGRELKTPGMVEALPKPVRDEKAGPVMIRRRDGWQDVQWTFTC